MNRFDLICRITKLVVSFTFFTFLLFGCFSCFRLGLTPVTQQAELWKAVLDCLDNSFYLKFWEGNIEGFPICSKNTVDVLLQYTCFFHLSLINKYLPPWHSTAFDTTDHNKDCPNGSLSLTYNALCIQSYLSNSQSFSIKTSEPHRNNYALLPMVFPVSYLAGKSWWIPSFFFWPSAPNIWLTVTPEVGWGDLIPNIHVPR